jgi:hypothetical protein
MIPPMISMEEGMADPAALRNESARQCKHQGERVAQVELTKEVIDGPCARGYLSDPKPGRAGAPHSGYDVSDLVAGGVGRSHP